MRRLDVAEVHRIIATNEWPPDFDRFERMLEIGADAGKRVRFVDPEDSSLVDTIADLVNERPAIRVEELARLLNLDLRTAERLARRVRGRGA